MFLFLVFSLPVLFGAVVLLPWGKGKAPRPLSLVSTYLKGMLLFFPGYLVILVMGRIFGFSYDGFLLYLSLLLRDHLVPLLTALAAFILLQRSLHLTGTDESTFLTAFACLGGYLTMVNLTDFLRMWGNWDGYVLFVLPFLRIASALVLAITAHRFYRWEGRDGWLFCAAGVCVALIMAVVSCCAVINRPWLAAALTIMSVAGAGALFAMQFPRTLRT